jgi:hypothetical protein
VEYWKVGVAPKLQYPKVIQSIHNFHPDPRLDLTPEEADSWPDKLGSKSSKNSVNEATSRVVLPETG